MKIRPKGGKFLGDEKFGLWRKVKKTLTGRPFGDVPTKRSGVTPISEMCEILHSREKTGVTMENR